MRFLDSLIGLANWEDRIGAITLRYGFEEPDSTRSRNYIYKWRASLLDAAEGYLGGEGENTIENACASLLSACKERFSYFPIADKNIVYDPDQIERIILQIKTISSNRNGAFLSLSFIYSPPFEQLNPAWEANITEGSHWHSYVETKIRGNSLNEVCAQLWEQLQKSHSD